MDQFWRRAESGAAIVGCDLLDPRLVFSMKKQLLLSKNSERFTIILIIHHARHSRSNTQKVTRRQPRPQRDGGGRAESRAPRGRRRGALEAPVRWSRVWNPGGHGA